jgi:hypothetical protein
VVRVALTAEGRALKAKARRVPTELACRAGFDVEDKRSTAKLASLRDDLHALVARMRELDLDE